MYPLLEMLAKMNTEAKQPLLLLNYLSLQIHQCNDIRKNYRKKCDEIVKEMKAMLEKNETANLKCKVLNVALI